MAKKGWNFLLTGTLVGLGTAAASAVLYRKTLPRPKGVDENIVGEFADKTKFEEYIARMKPITDWLSEQKMEDVFITSRDGLRLHALVLPAESPCGKTVIFHHGFTSNAMDNGTHAKFFHELGYDVILLDLRAHGQSEGDYVGFGILDRYDTLEWIRYAEKRYSENVKIVLHGTSMGAATVLMALGLKEVRKRVSAVIADCAYTSPAEIFAHVMKSHYHYPAPEPVIRLNGLFSRAKAGYAFTDYSTLEALKDSEVPVLLIHGAEDKFVPVWMSRENYEACRAPIKKLLIVEHAGHGSSLFEDIDLYQRTEKEFLDEVFAPQDMRHENGITEENQ